MDWTLTSTSPSTCGCTVALSKVYFFWNFANPINFLCDIFSTYQDLEKAFRSNIALSLRTGSRFAQILLFLLELGPTSVKVADRPSMCCIFEMAMVQAPQKQCSQVSDVQTHKDKYTNTQIQNTQIQLRSKLHIGPTCSLFLKR